MKVSIIGGGAWGTTLAQALADKNNSVLVRDINEDFVKAINELHIHPSFELTIPTKISATTSLDEALAFSDIIILCVPTKVMRSVIKEINTKLTSKKLFVNVSKGIEPTTSKTVSEIVSEEVDPNNLEGYVVLSGPSHAEELIFRKFTCLVAASTNLELAKKVQKLFSNEKYLRIYTSLDVIGVEVGGAVKNAIALVSGIGYGLGLGENARAALISRGMLELVQIVEALGGKKETVYGLSGLGDLIVTASSMNSRNFKAGLKIGEGQSVEKVLENASQTVEGVRAIIACYEIGKKYNLNLPIIETAYYLVSGEISAKESVKLLLSRKLKSEYIDF